jgi:hypothetical protein
MEERESSMEQMLLRSLHLLSQRQRSLMLSIASLKRMLSLLPIWDTIPSDLEFFGKDLNQPKESSTKHMLMRLRRSLNFHLISEFIHFLICIKMSGVENSAEKVSQTGLPKTTGTKFLISLSHGLLLIHIQLMRMATLQEKTATKSLGQNTILLMLLVPL